MPSSNVLVVHQGTADQSTYSGSMLLALADRVQLPAPQNPAVGDGTYQNPFVLSTLAQWRAAAPQGVKRIFLNVGGRLLLKRVNRGADGWDGYVTDVGPLQAAQARLAVKEQQKAQFPSTATQQVQGRGPNHRTDQARRTDPRWYLDGAAQDDPDFDQRLSSPLGADYAQIMASLNDYMDRTGEGDPGVARKMKQVLANSAAVTDLPPAAALLCTAWFSAESGRHPRSILSSLILLTLITECIHIQLPGAVGAISTQVRFSKVVEFSADLPHPMTGQGTVQRARAAIQRGATHAETVQPVRDIPGVLNRVSVQNLNLVEAREANIFIEFLARKLEKLQHVPAAKVLQNFTAQQVAPNQNPQNPQARPNILDDTHPSLFPAQRPPASVNVDQSIVTALGSVL